MAEEHQDKAPETDNLMPEGEVSDRELDEVSGGLAGQLPTLQNLTTANPSAYNLNKKSLKTLFCNGITTDISGKG